MAIAVCKFSGGACPQTPLESFLLLKLLKIKSVENNYAWKVTKIGSPSLKKVLNRPLIWKHFQKAYLLPLPGLNVLAFS